MSFTLYGINYTQDNGLEFIKSGYKKEKVFEEIEIVNSIKSNEFDAFVIMMEKDNSQEVVTIIPNMIGQEINVERKPFVKRQISYSDIEVA